MKVGWGGVEGWGEKAYNCNWITIKNLKKRQSIQWIMLIPSKCFWSDGGQVSNSVFAILTNKEKVNLESKCYK